MPKKDIFQDNPLEKDLNHILAKTSGLWENIRGKHLFITGGTGFFGCWFLESFAWANEKFNLNASVLVLTRDFNKFKIKAPHLANNPAIKFHIGDVRNFKFPKGEFSYIIHAAATSATDTFNNEDRLLIADTILEGTRHILDFAIKSQTKNLLFTSSGAVYGKQPSNMKYLSEDYCGTLDFADENSLWIESKRMAELLCVYYSKKYNINTKIVRCFSFIGPYLPLHIHYAVGNFIRDALSGGPIQINGDGTPYRSYLYASDLMIWLWTILFKGRSCYLYNVGSENDVTIAELANIVAKRFEGAVNVNIASSSVPNKLAERYVPSLRRAQEDLGLKQTIDIETAIERTISHIQSNKKLYF
jgi:dTDP-glucose 4,6-dehydratase